MHRAIAGIKDWWGGKERLDESYALYYKGRYLEELVGLLSAHYIKDDGNVAAESSFDQDRLTRTALRCMLIAFDNLEVVYVDPALPGEFRIQVGQLEVQMSDSNDVYKSGVPLLGRV